MSSKVSQWITNNYDRLVSAAKKNSNYADYAEDMLGIVIADIYRQLQDENWVVKYEKAVDNGTILGVFIGALRNQIHSNTSTGYRVIRRGLDDRHIDGYSDYVDSGSSIEEKEEFEERLLLVNQYLHYFYPVDVYVFKEVLFNNKTYGQTAKEYDITTSYVFRTINYIKLGLKMYMEFINKSKFDIYVEASELWETLRTRQTSSISITHKQMMYCYYNMLQSDDIADNIHSKEKFKKVHNWFKQTIIIEEEEEAF